MQHVIESGMTFIEWTTADSPISYEFAVKFMETRVAKILSGDARELVWLLEHPAIYTGGSTADESELLTNPTFPVYQTNRGGRYTYHGPGQRVAYVMLNLRERNIDVRCFINCLEQWMIDSLSFFNIYAVRRSGRIGIWVKLNDRSEAKIGAIGVRIRRSVSFHGVSLNINPNLEHYNAIIPCGISEHGVTSMSDLGITIKMAEFDTVLRQTFQQVFGKFSTINL